jgi:hypothetical protein
MTNDIKMWINAIKEADKKAEKLRYGQRSWKDYTREEKMASCNHRTGHFLLSKALNGDVKAQPLYCNLCPECYARHAEDHKIKFEAAAKRAKKKRPKGVWRKKIVQEGKEAGALKKRISRNQGSNHMEIAHSENNVTIWTLTVDEPGKNMNEIYGRPANPDEIDWNEVYEENRRSGRKVSYGGDLRKKNATPKEETKKVKVPTPQVIVPKSQQKMAEDIIYRTTYMKEAETSEELVKNLHSQFYRIINNLKAANINVLAVKDVYISMPAKESLKEYNKNIKSWQMSKDTPLLKDNGDNEDFYDLLYYPAEKKVNSGMPSKEEIARIAALNWG